MKYSEAIKLSKLSFPDNIKSCKVCSNYDFVLFSTYLRAFGGRDGIDYKVSCSGYQNLHNDLYKLRYEKWDLVFIVLALEDIFPELSYRTSSQWDYGKIEELISKSDIRIMQYIESLAWEFHESGQNIILMPPILTPPPLISSDPEFLHSALSMLLVRVEAELHKYMLKNGRLKIMNPRYIITGSDDSCIRDEMLLFQAGNPFDVNAICSIAQMIHMCFIQKKGEKKLLVTDLDNTLWKGIIGEDGPEKISAYPEKETYHYYVYQKYLKLLMSEGILLAICSKNNQADVESFFCSDLLMKNAGMQLVWNDFSCISCSWEAKSKQIEHICEELNLLPSSVVFVDDNPAEIHEVKGRLPEIEVLAFPGSKDIHGFLKALRRLFSGKDITGEDISRLKLYQKRKDAMDRMKGFSSYDEFLKSLDMRINFTVIKQEGEVRPFQLYNKTNQFNLTGVRLSLEEWKQYFCDSKRFCVAGALNDSYGDHGLVLVALLRYEESAVTVENMAISCRVFNRGIETAFLDWVTQYFTGISEIRGKLKKTEKNGACLNYYSDNGFVLYEKADGFDIYKTRRNDFKQHYLKINNQ